MSFDESKHPRDKDGKFTDGIGTNKKAYDSQDKFGNMLRNMPQGARDAIDAKNKTDFDQEKKQTTAPESAAVVGNQSNRDENSGNTTTVYDVIKNKEVNVKIHDKFITAKPYSLVESWINVSKRGYGYYFSIDVDGKRHFISIDPKTANGRRWVEPSLFGYKNMKITANGYIYVNERGYTNFVIKDLNNFMEH